jgi:opacity protein-like surface antigen
MKRIQFLILGIVVLMAVPSFALDQGYGGIRAGIYSPTGDLEDEDFGTGPAIEVFLGYFVHPNIAIEGATGWYHTDFSETVFDPFTGLTASDEINIDIIPLTATVKAVGKADPVSFYGGVGGGLYVALADVEVAVSGLGSVSDEDSDVVGGFHLVGGGDVALSDLISLGVEAKYIITGEAEAELFGVPFEGDLDGFTVMATLAISFF